MSEQASRQHPYITNDHHEESSLSSRALRWPHLCNMAHTFAVLGRILCTVDFS